MRRTGTPPYAHGVNLVRLRETVLRHPVLQDVRIQDVLLAGGLALLEVVTILALVVPFAGPRVPTTGVIVGWAVLFMAPLAARRRWPVAVMTVMAVHFFLYWPVGEINEIGAWVALGIAVYSAAAHGRQPLARWSFIVTVTVVGGAALFAGTREGPFAPSRTIASVLFVWLPFALGWSLGTMTRRLREYRSVLQVRNAELAAERDARSRQAVLEERVRIARELHDVVAHHVSVMAVQAAAARRLFHTRPDAALQAIGSVEEAGRDAIVDLQQLVGVLRQEEPRDLAPQPRMAELPRLLAGVEQAGLPVGLTIEGRQRPLPAGVELSAYRIVQEALTNTIKHAGATRADVVVRYRDVLVEVEVLDDGAATSARPGHDGGNGLVGMRERVSVHGGTLEAGPRPDGGYRVRAVLRGNGS